MTQVDCLGAAVSVFFESGAFGTIVRILFLVSNACPTYRNTRGTAYNAAAPIRAEVAFIADPYQLGGSHIRVANWTENSQR